MRDSWREFPYYAQRYGVRGWRFSLSDTGWIQTLCELEPSQACAQVRWLGGVLAARGMPQYLLERHLTYLHGTLLAMRPEHTPRYGVLKICAEHLRALREARIAHTTMVELAQDFDAAWVTAVNATIAAARSAP